MLRALTVLGTAVILILPASQVSAGGWATFIDLKTSHLAVGHEVEAGTEFLFASIPQADRARRSGDFHAYLIRNFDWSTVDRATRTARPGDWWRLGSADGVRVGRVSLSGWDANLAVAHTQFTVPDIQTGTYAFMFCDAGCRNPLGDIVPSRVQVVSEPAIVDLSIQNARLGTQLYRLERMTREATRAADRTASLSENVRRLRLEVGALRGRLLSAESQGTRPEPIPWFASAGWFLAGGATVLAGLIVVRRRRKPVPAALAPERIPDDPGELVGSGWGVRDSNPRHIG